VAGSRQSRSPAIIGSRLMPDPSAFMRKFPELHGGGGTSLQSSLEKTIFPVLGAWLVKAIMPLSPIAKGASKGPGPSGAGEILFPSWLADGTTPEFVSVVHPAVRRTSLQTSIRRRIRTQYTARQAWVPYELGAMS
jgi:hypothetical protein